MNPKSQITLKQLMFFIQHVALDFLHNRGILLAGGVGYNILLSIIPLFAVMASVLVYVVDEEQLRQVMAIQAQHLAPANEELVLEAVEGLLQSHAMFGWIGFAFLIFFSSFAFSMLDDAVALIFHKTDYHIKRGFWFSKLLPYLFVLVFGAFLVALSLLVSASAIVAELFFNELKSAPLLSSMTGMLFNLLGFLGMFALFSAIYKIMPRVKIGLRRALVGGFIAALLWEIVRELLAYYFIHISLVETVYGSLANLIILLLGLEFSAGILLFGAQIIAALEFNAHAGNSWHHVPGQNNH